MNYSCYWKRNKNFYHLCPANSAAIVFAANECIRTVMVVLNFRQNSDFYYLTGFLEPQAVAVFLPSRQEGEYVLFNRKRDREREQWEVFRMGQECAVSQLGVNQAFSIDDIQLYMPDLLADEKRFFFYWPTRRMDRQVFAW